MKKGLKNFIDFIEERYEVKLEQPNDFDQIYQKVGFVFYSPVRNESEAIREFFENSNFEFTGFDRSRMIVRKLSRACSGTGKNKVYLKQDYTFTKDETEALLSSNDQMIYIIKQLKKESVLYKNLKIDYAF